MAKNQSETPNRSESAKAESYRIADIKVTSAGPDSPAAYEYSDLDRSSTSPLYVLIHAVHWSLYFFVLFPLHYTVRLFRWSFRLHHLSPAGRLTVFLSDGFENLKKMKFLTNYDRFILYLRASRVFTPAQIFPFVQGNTPVKEGSNSKQHPLPENWDSIRQAVYGRDNYHCVNCGAAGGPHGNAELHADHVLPRSRDGVDHPQNLRTLCRGCHEARHARIFN